MPKPALRAPRSPPEHGAESTGSAELSSEGGVLGRLTSQHISSPKVLLSIRAATSGGCSGRKKAGRFSFLWAPTSRPCSPSGQAGRCRGGFLQFQAFGIRAVGSEQRRPLPDPIFLPSTARLCIQSSNVPLFDTRKINACCSSGHLGLSGVADTWMDCRQHLWRA